MVAVYSASSSVKVGMAAVSKGGRSEKKGLLVDG
jgi:hypothetical protein